MVWSFCFAHIDNYASVVRTVHAYNALITNLPSYHHDELKTIASTAFRFADKTPAEGYVTSLAEILGKPYAREDILSAGALMYGDWDAEAQAAAREIVTKYMGPEKARVTLMVRDEWDRVTIDGKPLWEHGAEKAKWDTEKWYGTQYTVRKTDFADGKAVEGLQLPPPNGFIPTNFDIEKKEVTEVRRSLQSRMLSVSHFQVTNNRILVSRSSDR